MFGKNIKERVEIEEDLIEYTNYLQTSHPQDLSYLNDPEVLKVLVEVFDKYEPEKSLFPLAFAISEGCIYEWAGNEIKPLVLNDSLKYYDFFMKTKEWQKKNNVAFSIDEYPFDALIRLTWRGTTYFDLETHYGDDPAFKMAIGNESPHNHSIRIVFDMPKLVPIRNSLSKDAYEWYFITDFENLSRLREKVIELGIISYEDLKRLSSGEIGKILDRKIYNTTNIDTKYWDYSPIRYTNARWFMSPPKGIKRISEVKEKLITIGNYTRVNWLIYDPNYEIKRFVERGRGEGLCVDYEILASCIAKSLGIPEMKVGVYGEVYIHGFHLKSGHVIPFYYDNDKKKWICANIMHWYLYYNHECLWNNLKSQGAKPFDIGRLYFLIEPPLSLPQNISKDDINKFIPYTEMRVSEIKDVIFDGFKDYKQFLK